MTKHELQQYRWLKLNIKKLQDKILELETIATKQTSILTDMPRHSSGGDRIADNVAMMADLAKILNIKLTESHKRVNDIELAINELDEREQYLIRARYIDCKAWEQICVDMGYEWAQIHRIHANALRQLKCDTK